MHLNDEPQNYYDILELTPDATPQEIRSAYLRLKSSYSKDNIAHYSVYSREETEQVLAKIEEAYMILSNSEKRKTYDHSHADFSHTAPRIEVSAEVTPKPALAEPHVATNPIDNFIATGDDSLIMAEQIWDGPALKRVRESKRLSIEDLADYTRISRNHLVALEEEVYHKLPAIVYVRGFLQQICKRLKLPTDEVVKKYLDKMKAARPE